MSGCAALTNVRYVVTLESQILGQLNVEENQIFTFPSGLFGFPESRSFAFLAAQREGFYWLQSIEHAALTFLLADPFLFFDGYAVDLAPADLTDLQGADSSDVAIFAIVTLPHSGDALPTANLQGPLAVNFDSRRGKQLALQDGQYGVRCAFRPDRQTTSDSRTAR